MSRAMACRSAAVVVGADHSAGMSAASRSIAARSSQRQRHWLLRQKAIVFGLDTQLIGQRGLPALLQRAHHQTVLRLDRVVLASCPLDVIACALKPLFPLPVQCLALQLEVLGQLQADFQCRWCQRLQHQLCHQRVQGGAAQRLADRPAIVHG